MDKKFIGIAIMAMQLANLAYGMNYRRLDDEANTYYHRILSKEPNDKELIKSSFCFLSDNEKAEEKYLQPESFLKLYNEISPKVQDSTFQEFSNNCKKIFEESDNARDKASVYLLLEKVSEKYLKYLRLHKKLESLKQDEENRLEGIDTQKTLEYFLNVDKILPVN